jgi:hypothetical protein
VAIKDGEPELTRIGVGDHLMLGGDNMDLALAHLVESRLPASEGKPVGGALFAADGALPRRQGATAGAGAPESVLLTLLGGGARLIGGARTVELQRDEVLQHGRRLHAARRGR